MNNFIAENVKLIEVSGIRKFYNKVVKIPGALSLTIGQPDFPVPESVKVGMIEAINSNRTAYTANAGLLELRDEISKYLNTLDIHYLKEEICVTVGGSEGLMSVFMTLINKSDKVLIPNPGYPAYESCVKLLSGEVVNYELNENDFSIDFEGLKEIIKREKPKVMVLSYPCNPTGAILTKDDCEKLHKIISENNIMVVTDEIYSALVYEDEYYSIAQFKDIREKLIYVSGFSKMFSMTGLRVGYVCAVNEVISNIIKVHQYSVSCAPSISQWGAVYGLKESLKDVEYMKSEFKKRRDYMYNALKKLNFELNIPKGAFYIFPNIKRWGINSEEFCEKLLNEEKLAIVPGTAFGSKGEGYIRLSYASSMEELKRAIKLLEAFIKRSET